MRPKQKLDQKSKMKALETALRAHALAKPQSTEDFPWGERAIKVRGKVFLFMRATAAEVSFSVKLPRSGFQALTFPFVEPSGYGMGRHGWITARVVGNSAALRDQFKSWIDESYVAVAPKAVLREAGETAATKGPPRKRAR